MEPSCVKYGTCKTCAGTNRVGVPGSTPLLATEICLICYRESNNKRSEEVLIETSNKRELQAIDYICEFYENRRD